MKEDKPKGKSQQPPSEQRGAQPRRHDEDVDFEILDALQQIEQTGKAADDIEDEDMIDLNLEDEDFMFTEDEEDIPETEEFHFDKDVAESLEGAQDEGMDDDLLTAQDDDLALAQAFGDDLGAEPTEKHEESEDFSLDLDEDAATEMNLTFDDEMNLDLDEKFDEASLNIDDSEAMEPFIGSEEETIAEDHDAEKTSAVLQLDSFEQEPLVDESLDFGEEDADMSLEEQALDSEGVEMAFEASDEAFEDMNFEPISAMEAPLEEDTSPEQADVSSSEYPDMRETHENEPLSGKAVISVDGDQVIDLGDEHDLEQMGAEPFEETVWEEEDATDEAEIKEEAEMDLSEFNEENAQELLSSFAAEETEETENDFAASPDEEAFMASLDDIAIDLGENETELGEPAITEEGDLPAVPAEATESESEEFKFPPIEEEEETVASDDVEASESFVAQDLAVDVQDQMLEAELREAELVSEPFEWGAGSAPQPESDMERLRALGLSPRLTDTEVEKFGHMVQEAKTLQEYVEKLDLHKAEIRERIYQKLSHEYAARKVKIFREPEFISIRIDVEQDLQDMLAKRTEFSTTISRLNDELEEVNIRHLVGELTDDMLAEKQQEQRSGIDKWQQKREDLEHFILRYQELLESEQALNPLANESEESASPQEMPPEEAIAPGEDLLDETVPEPVAEETLPQSEEPFAEEPEPAAAEHEEPETAEHLEMEVPSEELPGLDALEELSASDELEKEMEDLDTLTSIFDEESEEGEEGWDTEGEEDSELTVESFDEQEFTTDSEEPEKDEEDFEFEELPEPEEAIEEQISGVDDEEASEQEEMISCKKCGRTTPAAEKFCVNCGAKVR